MLKTPPPVVSDGSLSGAAWIWSENNHGHAAPGACYFKKMISAANGSFAVTAEVKNTDDANHSVIAYASLADSKGNVVAELSEVIPLHAQSGHSVSFTKQLDRVQLWSVEAPNL